MLSMQIRKLIFWLKLNISTPCQASDWEPDLTTLDALVASLQIDGMPSSGIEHQLWELEGRSMPMVTSKKSKIQSTMP